ncbi:MAG TPA: adenylosuccinate synthase [Armatimonadota bacterium]|nr:adenylosuccinate synthase [Armatimonadota bacterium]
MGSIVIIGTQWGDEGKGRVVDVYAANASTVVRYQGGDNAGHTVKIGEQHYALHLIPSGIVRQKPSILGNGMVINPKSLLKEITDLEATGLEVRPYLFIAEEAHMIMPYHLALDGLSERAMGDGKIGTTLKGIGPAYTDKFSRTHGLRIGDLRNAAYFRARLEAIVADKNAIITKLYGSTDTFDAGAIFDEYLGYYAEIGGMIRDTAGMIAAALRRGEDVVFEGANATMLDIDHGTYPFVTCSTPTAGGAAVGAGVGPTAIDHVIGVVKAYTSRVGAGPFPTELPDATGDRIRELGHEYGTTTGRPRRCGWLDLCVLRKAARVNGLDYLAVTHLDILDEFADIPVCVGYEIDGARVDVFPANVWEVEKATPIYEVLPGWRQPIADCRDFDALPVNARRYLHRVSELVGVPVCMITVGSERSQTIVMREAVTR